MPINARPKASRQWMALWLAACCAPLCIAHAQAQPTPQPAPEPAPPPALPPAPPPPPVVIPPAVDGEQKEPPPRVEIPAPPPYPSTRHRVPPSKGPAPTGAEPAIAGAPDTMLQTSMPPLAPVPATPTVTTTVATVPLRLYGILWGGVFTTQPVQSFSFPTAVAPTAAANPALFPNPHQFLLKFDVQQTRVGLVVGEGTQVKGTVEMDYVHFEQSSPQQSAFPRLRIAAIEWRPSEKNKFFFGQTWDIFGNATGPQLLSHSFNIVGTLFQAGNIGFMRIQLGWLGTFGHWEFALAAGQQGSNVGPVYNNIERSATPTGAARIMYKLSGNRGVIGASGIGTSLKFSNATNTATQRRATGGGVLFADVTLAALNIHSELYCAQNLANTGTLNLGQGRYGASVADAGGYISGRYTIGKHGLTAMFGYAQVLQPSHVEPGYLAATSTTPNTATTLKGPGIDYNLTAHVGYWYSPLRGLSVVVEPYVYDTKWKLAAADAAKFNPRNVSWGASLGTMFQF